LLRDSIVRNMLSSTPQGAGVVAAHWGMVDEVLIASARGRGLRVFGWTANAVHMIDPLITAGAAAIVTDKVRAACVCAR
jgi:glycerophosphoryl diester phosphodiesterase